MTVCTQDHTLLGFLPSRFVGVLAHQEEGDLHLFLSGVEMMEVKDRGGPLLAGSKSAILALTPQTQDKGQLSTLTLSSDGFEDLFSLGTIPTLHPLSDRGGFFQPLSCLLCLALQTRRVSPVQVTAGHNKGFEGLLTLASVAGFLPAVSDSFSPGLSGL
jgi:hypothetical protein